jgi:LmbE family N-acetylglucosaminyl deacetylase
VVAPDPVRHPDHVATPGLVQRACFLARLVRYAGALGDARWWPGPPAAEAAEAWTPEAQLEVCPDDGTPQVIFDVSSTWEAKQRALACFASQFRRDPGRRATAINAAAFAERIERRGRAWGARAGVAYGEALRTTALPVLGDLPAERWA